MNDILAMFDPLVANENSTWSATSNSNLDHLNHLYSVSSSSAQFSSPDLDPSQDTEPPSSASSIHWECADNELNERREATPPAQETFQRKNGPVVVSPSNNDSANYSPAVDRIVYAVGRNYNSLGNDIRGQSMPSLGIKSSAFGRGCAMVQEYRDGAVGGLSQGLEVDRLDDHPLSNHLSKQCDGVQGSQQLNTFQESQENILAQLVEQFNAAQIAEEFSASRHFQPISESPTIEIVELEENDISVPSFPSHDIAMAIVPDTFQSLSNYDDPSMPRAASYFYIDSHCHLDSLFGKLQYRQSYDSLKRLFCETWSKSYVGCITNFCFPSNFMNDHYNFFDTILENEDVRATIGCHPRFATDYKPEVEDFLFEKMSHARVVGMGEMGLDYSTRNLSDEVKDVQKDRFTRQLKISKNAYPHKPIVLHCRDANDDCFEIMQMILPHNHPIHFHCYFGTYDNAQRWSDYFTNMYFGVTTSICAPHPAQVEFIQRIPLNRLLIETDAPHFLPAEFRRNGQLQFNHPGLGSLVGQEIAKYRRTTVADVFETIYENTLRLYNSFYCD